MPLQLLKSKWVLVVVGIIVLLLLSWATGILKFNVSTTYKFSIPPSQLLPFASHADVRNAVCDVMREGLFNEACQKDFDEIGKNDKAKIDAVFTLIEKIQNDQNVSDYERYMLGQVIFSSLPTKDSPLAKLSTKPSLLKWLTDAFGSIAYAEELATNEEEFKAQMEQDLRAIADDLPEGDNAWVVTVMISRHVWIDGERQPIYSEEYGELVDPYPASSDRNEQNIEFHVRSSIGGRSSGETYSGIGSYTGTSDDIFYSFTIASWQSQPDGGEESELADIISTTHYTEDGYAGDDLIGELFRKVNMDAPRESVQKRDEKAEESANSDSSFENDGVVFVPISEKECRKMSELLKLGDLGLEYRPDGLDELGNTYKGVCNWSNKGTDKFIPFKIVQDAELSISGVHVTKFKNKRMQEKYFKELKAGLREYYDGVDWKHEESSADNTYTTTLQDSYTDYDRVYIAVSGGINQIFGLVGECYYFIIGSADIIADVNEYHYREMASSHDVVSGSVWINHHPDFDHGLGEIKSFTTALNKQLREGVVGICDAR